MKHRGEILKRAIDSSGKTKPEIAKAIKVSESKLWRMFQDPNVSFDYLIAVGKFIRHDFSDEFKELTDPKKLKEAEENLKYKLKYFELLEKYASIQEELLKHKKAS